MRLHLRSWVRRWLSRRAIRPNLLATERPARPRLVLLENKSLPSGTAQGFVFEDNNFDGAFQSTGAGGTDVGLANVTVTAFDAGGAAQGTTTTAADGSYLLALGGTGPYRLEFTGLPATHGFGVQGADAGGPVQFVADGGAGNLGLALNLKAAATAATPIEIGDRVWFDTNANGIQDAGEPGIGNVQVQLFDTTSKTIIGTATTDAAGRFLFNSGSGTSTASTVYAVALVPGGLYELRAQLNQAPLAGTVVAPFQAGSAINDSDAANDVSNTFAFAAVTVAGFGEGNPNADFGFVNGPATAIIGDFVWQDFNGNGVQDANEPGLSGATVRLLDVNSKVLATQTTDVNGRYLFTNVTPGNYRLDIALPAGYSLSPAFQGGDPLRDSDFDPATGVTIVFAVGAGSAILDCDAGAFPANGPTGAIGDFSWFDANENGIFDQGEFGIPNTVVNLYDGTGSTLLATTKTDVNGLYLFPNLAAGQYIVQFIPITGFFFSPPFQGGNNQIDSNVTDFATGKTPVVTLLSGEVNLTIDAGLTKPTTGVIGDFVWVDLNCDGIFQQNEPAQPGVTVNLLDKAGNFLQSTVTDVNGLYFFSKLQPADYIVEFVLPAGFVFSPPFQGGNGQIDSNADPLTGRTPIITVTAGSVDLTIDAGLCPTAVLGDFVWLDLNCDGIFQAGEPGFAGATVNLLDAGGKFLTSTTTDGAGKYQFANLAPADYIVQFILPPGGFTFSPPFQGGNGQIDSNADPVTGLTPTITLLPGETNDTVDAGICPPPTVVSRVGDFVFIDLNCDGIQQPTDPGLAGVTVTLLDAAGKTLATTVTDKDGKYLFDNLAPGDYRVQFVTPPGFAFTKANAGAPGEDSDADPATGLTPVFTLAAGQTDLTRDAGVVVLKHISGFVYEDCNDNGVREPGEPGIGGVTITFSGVNDLGQAVKITTVTDATGFYQFSSQRPGNYTLTEAQPQGYLDGRDTPGTPFGGVAVEPDTITGIAIDCDLINIDGVNYNFGEVPPSSLRGKVYVDLNNDGIPQPTEPGIAAVRLTLTGTDNRGNAVNRTMVTGPDGTYAFTGLRFGTYTITEAQPPDFLDGKDRVGSVGGVLGNDVISQIPLPCDVDGFDYDFGELLKGGGNGNKEDLLASAGGAKTPNLFDFARLMPTTPSFANAISVTQLCSPAPARFLVTSGDAGQAPVIRVFDYGTGTLRYTITAYNAAFLGGVRTAVGDVTGDGIVDVITAPGAGGGPHIRVFDGSTGNVVAEFFAYDAAFTGGVYVAAGDVNGDGVAEIITGAGEGGGPHVKIFSANGTVIGQYFAYAPTFAGGVRVASGDTNNDGIDDVITAAGPGGGPHVRVFSGATSTELLGFFAYDAAFTGGVFVAAGDVDADGDDDIITGAGAGGGSHVRVLNGTNAAEIYGFFAFGTFTPGVRVGAADINGDGLADVITSPGAGLPSYVTVTDVSRRSTLEAFLAFDPTVLGGAFVSGG